MHLPPTLVFSLYLTLPLTLTVLDHDFIKAHATVPVTFDQVLLLAVVSPLGDVSVKLSLQ